MIHGFGALLGGKLGGIASTVTAGVLVPASAVAVLAMPPSVVKRIAAPVWKAKAEVFGVSDFARELTDDASRHARQRVRLVLRKGRGATESVARRADRLVERVTEEEQATELTVAGDPVVTPAGPVPPEHSVDPGSASPVDGAGAAVGGEPNRHGDENMGEVDAPASPPAEEPPPPPTDEPAQDGGDSNEDGSDDENEGGAGIDEPGDDNGNGNGQN